MSQDKQGLISISTKNSKMGAVPSFSTLPGLEFGCSESDTSGCDPNPKIRTHGERCYVLNFLRYPEVAAAYGRNFDLVNSDISEVESQIKTHLIKEQPRKFRWHVSGDILSLEYLEMMIRLAKRFKNTRFLAYTKALRILRKIDRADLPANLVIFISSMSEAQTQHIQSDNELSKYPIAYCSADLDSDHNGLDNKIHGYTNCPEQITKGRIKCDQCMVCWNGKPVRFFPH